MELLITDREGGRAPHGEMDSFEEVHAKKPTPAKPHCKHGEPYKINNPGTTSSCCAKFIN